MTATGRRGLRAAGAALAVPLAAALGPTKQSVSSAAGMVVMASNDVTQRYWHADLSLDAP